MASFRSMLVACSLVGGIFYFRIAVWFLPNSRSIHAAVDGVFTIDRYSVDISNNAVAKNLKCNRASSKEAGQFRFGFQPAITPRELSRNRRSSYNSISITKYTINSRSNKTMAIISGSVTAGNDNILLDGADDFLSVLSGDDTVNAGAGNDLIFGGFGNDFIRGEEGNDFIAGDEGNDEIRGNGGNDTLQAASGDDIMRGNSGNDSLLGGSGNDFLSGGSGNDILDGFSRAQPQNQDTLTGGTGADTFRLGSSVSSYYLDVIGFGNIFATITDFNFNEGDRIEINGNFSDYFLQKSLNVSGGSALDTQIFRNGDRIAIVEDNTNVFANSFITV